MDFIKGKTVGIDLGTTFSTLAIVNDEGEPTPIPNEDDSVETASLIVLADNHHVIVGPNRSRAAMEDPENVIERIKREMGITGYKRTFDGHEITPEFISSLILRKLKQDGEKNIGLIGNAVITVPYYFNDTRRQATIDAGKIAGLNVISVINEPTAAVLTYAWHRGELGKTMEQKRQVLIFDLGGGTFDVTVVEYTGNHFKVKSTDGDVKLGGIDWNDRLADYVCEQFKAKYGTDPRTSPKTLQMIRNDCDIAKIQLSEKENVIIPCRFEGKGMQVPISRQKFEEMTFDLLQRTSDTVAIVVKQAGITYEQLDAIVLVGGSTYMPQVPIMLEKLTGKKPYREMDPLTAVARGAAIHAAILEARYNQNSKLDDRIKKLLIHIDQEDVNSHGLGIVLTNADNSATNHIMIPKNTTLPFSISKLFQTNRENQQRISVQVIEGDAPDPASCSLLGKCRITDLPPNLPKGTQVEVTYSFDRNGRVSVTAREKLNNQEAKIEIERRGTLNEKQIENFIKLSSEYMIE